MCRLYNEIQMINRLQIDRQMIDIIDIALSVIIYNIGYVQQKSISQYVN